MVDSKQHIQQITEIRNIMERSSRFISLSGLSGVFAGFFALAGAGAFHIYVNHRLSYGYGQIARAVPVDIANDFLLFCIADAAAVLMLSICFALFFTWRKSQNTGQMIWDKSARRMLLSLFIPLIAGGIYCLMLLQYGWFGLIAPTTLIFYGLALLNASKHTLDEIKWLGISEIALGLVGLFFIGYGVTLWAIGFGVLHIIYGLMMYVRYDTKPQEKKYW